MNPVRRILRILFVSVHAYRQRHTFALAGTDLDRVWKRDRFPMRAFMDRCSIPQRFQFGLYPVNVSTHSRKNHATRTGMLGIVRNR